MIISLLGACALRIVWIYTVFIHVRTLDSLYMAYPITWGITLVAHTVCVITLIRKLETSSKPPKAVRQLPEFQLNSPAESNKPTEERNNDTCI